MTPQLGSNSTVLTNLSGTLWRMREVLDHLLFKIFETQLILDSGDQRWLGLASRELDSALQEVRHLEVMRAVESVTVADRLGRSPNMTLQELANIAPAPWPTIFLEHREALRALTAQIDQAAAGTRPPSAPETEVRSLYGRPDALDEAEADVVRKFLADTLSKARQVSLIAFLS